MKHRSVAAVIVLAGVAVFLAGCAQAPEKPAPEASATPTTTTTRTPEKLSDQDAWKLGEQDGEHRVGRIDSDTPEVRSLPVGPMQGKKYYVSFVCDASVDLVVGVDGVFKEDGDEYDTSMTDDCDGEPKSAIVGYDPSEETLDSLYVKVNGEGEWAATFGWFDDKTAS